MVDGGGRAHDEGFEPSPDRSSGCLASRELPLSAGLCSVAPPADRVRFALAGGDDYELLFTAGPADRARLTALDAGVVLRRIGGVTEGGGVLAELGHGDRLVALRADLDALPVDDLISDPWRSTTPGVAHACGHDVHTAGLVGAGLALAEVAARAVSPANRFLPASRNSFDHR